MINTIKQTIENKNKSGKMAFVAYAVSCYPDADFCEKELFAMQENGVDIVELGIPFSDPIADGTVIQSAYTQMLEKGLKLKDTLDFITKIRVKGFILPIIIFTYYNPILSISYHKFIKQLVDARAQGLLVVDLPPEEASQDFFETMDSYGIEAVFLTSPTTSEKRLQLINQLSTGMVYYVLYKGITGVREGIPLDNIEKLKRARRLISDKPIAAGFGISGVEQVRGLRGYAEAFVVGSALVLLAGKKDLKGIANLCRELTQV